MYCKFKVMQVIFYILLNCFKFKGRDIKSKGSAKQGASDLRTLDDKEKRKKPKIRILDSIIKGEYQISQDTEQ